MRSRIRPAGLLPHHILDAVAILFGLVDLGAQVTVMDAGRVVLVAKTAFPMTRCCSFLSVRLEATMATSPISPSTGQAHTGQPAKGPHEDAEQERAGDHQRTLPAKDGVLDQGPAGLLL